MQALYCLSEQHCSRACLVVSPQLLHSQMLPLAGCGASV